MIDERRVDFDDYFSEILEVLQEEGKEREERIMTDDDIDRLTIMTIIDHMLRRQGDTVTPIHLRAIIMAQLIDNTLTSLCETLKEIRDNAANDSI